jgi:hypothetical protein
MKKIKRKLRTTLEYVFGRMPGSYGQDKILRSYLRFPNLSPLNAQIQHGWYSTEIPDLERDDQIEVMLVWSSRIAKEWAKKSKKRVLILGAPFLIYKEQNRITRSLDAKGTVVFPNHSTPSSIEKYDAAEYCDQLDALPEEFKPITVCLHYRDVDRYGPQFSVRGFTVTTAGDSRQPGDGFVKNFYQILCSHRFSCSNEIGSYTFYSVNLGIPFFIYGPDSLTVLKNDESKTIEKTEFRIQTRELFKEIRQDISAEQTQFVASELGVFDRMSSKELGKFFLNRFFFHELPLYPVRLIRSIYLHFIGHDKASKDVSSSL